MLSQTERQWIPIFTEEDHTLHLKVKDTHLCDHLPDVGSDVDVVCKINCAWFNQTYIGVSMKVVSICPHGEVCV